MIIRKASEGKVLTNGEIYTDSIFAPDNYNPEEWWEIDESEVLNEDEATIEDYEEALGRFGV